MKYLRIFTIALLVLSICAGALAEQEKAAPNLPGSSMVIPWADFKQILEKLSDPQTTPDPVPPYEALVSSADYRAQVYEDTVSVVVDAQVVVLAQKGWASVPVIRAGVPISEARLDGAPVALAKEADGNLYLVAKGQGAHTLTLKMELNLTKNSGPDSFSLPTLQAQVNRLEVRVGKPDLNIMIAPKGTLSSQNAGASSVAVGSFPPMGNVTISWARSVPQSVKETARVSAEVRTMLTVGEGLGVYTAIIDYDILHKPVSKFTMTLPADVVVADVSTEGLVDWKVAEGDWGKRIDVAIAYEAVGRHQVAVTYERTLDEGDTTTFTTSDLVVGDVVHETGFLAVAVQTNVQVSPKEGTLKNLATLDQTELPADLRGNNDQKVLFGYKYIKHPAHLELEVIKHKDASVLTCEIEQANYKVMINDRGKMITEAIYRVANRSRQYLTLTLPEGMDLWGVYRDGEPVKAAETDGKVLLPIFSANMRNTSTIKVVAYKKSHAFWFLGRKNIELPTLDAGASKVYLELYLPYRYRGLRFGGNLKPTGQIPQPVVSILSGEGEKGVGDLEGKLDDGILASGKNNWEYDEDLLNENIKYRNDQSKVQKQVVNIPVSASNAMYNPTMARGALAVEFDVAWEGRQHRFATSIVDPGEKTNVSFIFSRKSNSSLIPLVVLFFAGFVGYMISLFILAKRSELLSKPDAKAKRYGIIAIALIAILSLFNPGGKTAFILGVIAGAVIMLIRYIAVMIKASPPKEKKPTSQAPVVQTQPKEDEVKEEGDNS